MSQKSIVSLDTEWKKDCKNQVIYCHNCNLGVFNGEINLPRILSIILSWRRWRVWRRQAIMPSLRQSNVTSRDTRPFNVYLCVNKALTPPSKYIVLITLHASNLYVNVKCKTHHSILIFLWMSNLQVHALRNSKPLAWVQ